MPGIDEALERARGRLGRLDARQAAAEMSLGALLVDTRPEKQRSRDGEIPGALCSSGAPTPLRPGGSLKLRIINGG